MLNGKFYTGLPPKMEGRPCGNGQNRQESHFFWPDDTRVDSAVETRVKRRNSLQLQSGAERPHPTASQKLSSLQAEPTPEVNTRQMFHKEFAKSSIQFYDNLQPSNSNTNSNNNKSRLLNRARREVTPKLTDVDPLPAVETVAEIDPSAARRNQAYSSKIQFYDYVNTNDADTTQNNVRRPKMDMNNKREVELNSKNSPKLQVKHNVRHLSVERDAPQLRLVTKKPLNDGQQWQQPDTYESIMRPPVMAPRKILKQQPWIEDFDESMLNYMDNGMQQLRLRSSAPAKKHVTYNEEAAEYAYYDDCSEPSEGRQLRQSLPNMRTGSGQQLQQQQQQQPGPYVETGRNTKSLNNYNKKSHNNYNEYNNNSNSSSNNNSYNNSNSNSLRSRKILPKLPELTTTTTRRFDDTRTTATASDVDNSAAAAAAAPAAAEATSPSDPRKHLRSSLCFNGDALVVDVGAAPAPTSAVATARRSAGRRINVGLPD
ncbi:PREDICTED: protein PIEZO homolog isoform X2 [Drosophila arizonae]|uniref:Protein PIEZO homolog isoform X2 n=1 Tax=Drosophila arizonae TaxID=7263 RepID=A0ABM1PVK1_DROAR|nr:PREDICTED: protein PIEZO homolog isoform X2 [Drosophila arizonae]